MTTIGSYVGILPDGRTWDKSAKLADNDTFVGIEIELENLRRYQGDYQNQVCKNGLWKCVPDGSLRNHGLEFVMSTHNGDPLKGGDIVRALGEFTRTMKAYIEDGNEPPSCSKRTSIHVHMDVRDMELPHLKKLFLLYAIFEETFFKWSDPDRWANTYCRSLEHHTDIRDRLADIIGTQNDVKIPRILNSGNKYDAMNFLSIKQRGSLEFRLMRGTYDTSLILKWVNMLLALKVAAADNEVVVDTFPEQMSVRGIDNLIDIVFGDWGQDLKPHATNQDILNGIRVAQDILVTPIIKGLEASFAKHSAKSSSHLNLFKEHNMPKEAK